MKGESGKYDHRRKVDAESVLRAYFRHELETAEADLPFPPVVPVVKADLVVQAEQGMAGQNHLAMEPVHPVSGLRSNLSSVLLAACVLGTAALALSCSPRTPLASSIGRIMKDQGLEILKQDSIKVAGLVWQQGQEYFRQKHSGIVDATVIPAAEEENL
jgi:hypothetical protein